MSFESLRSLEIEYEAAISDMHDHEYARSVGYDILVWCLKGTDYGTPYTCNEVECHKYCNGLETEGACRIFSQWCVEHGFEDDPEDAYTNLSGQRDDGWTTMDEYELPENEDLTVRGCMVNGACVYAEVWYKDTKVGFIRID